MSDLKNYIEQRKTVDAAFAEEYDSGYADFKIGVVLRQAREQSGLTQEQIARRLKTKKSSIARIESHAEETRLSTLKRYAKAIGKNVRVVIA